MMSKDEWLRRKGARSHKACVYGGETIRVYTFGEKMSWGKAIWYDENGHAYELMRERTPDTEDGQIVEKTEKWHLISMPAGYDKTNIYGELDIVALRLA